jgi:hypothetical protein
MNYGENLHSNLTDHNNFQNNSQGDKDSSEANKLTRGSKYRGVSRNGNQWQVI